MELQTKELPYFSSPALSDNHVYIGGRDKGMHCIDRVNGSKLGGSQLEEESTVLQSSQKKSSFGSMDGKFM